jgi:hypothetical protein
MVSPTTTEDLLTYATTVKLSVHTQLASVAPGNENKALHEKDFVIPFLSVGAL